MKLSLKLEINGVIDEIIEISSVELIELIKIIDRNSVKMKETIGPICKAEKTLELPADDEYIDVIPMVTSLKSELKSEIEQLNNNCINSSKTRQFDLDEVKRVYIDENKSFNDCLAYFKTSSYTFSRFCRENNIKKRKGRPIEPIKCDNKQIEPMNKTVKPTKSTKSVNEIAKPTKSTKPNKSVSNPDYYENDDDYDYELTNTVHRKLTKDEFVDKMCRDRGIKRFK